MIKKHIRRNFDIISGVKNIKSYDVYKGKKKIFYLLKPDHGNMGDQAIAFATLKFYKKYFSEYEIIEIDRKELYKNFYAIKRSINKNDLIVLHGGGNMGNLYLPEEESRRFVIKKFKDNNIISMTQTITFTNDSEGKKEQEISQKVYNSHNKLMLLAREEKSYEVMKGLFRNKVLKVPDIVFFLSGKLESNNINRELITTCLRDDKESIYINKKNEFIKRLKNNYDNVFVYDTNINKDLNINDRNKELEKMWDKFKNSKIVITDRLHGMIFCIITKTPCIVLKSLDCKITESYKWVEKLEFVKLVDKLDYKTINEIITEYINKPVIVNIDFEKEYFDDLANNIREIIK